MADLIAITDTYDATNRQQSGTVTMRKLRLLIRLFQDTVWKRDFAEFILITNIITRLGLKTSQIYMPLQRLFQAYRQQLGRPALTDQAVLENMFSQKQPSLTVEARASLVAAVVGNRVGGTDRTPGLSLKEFTFYGTTILQFPQPDLTVYRLEKLAPNDELSPDQLFRLKRLIRNLKDAGCQPKEYGIALVKVVGNRHYATDGRNRYHQQLQWQQTVFELLSLKWKAWIYLDQALRELTKHVQSHTLENKRLAQGRPRLQKLIKRRFSQH